jgi:hypothetical protein
LFFAEGPFQLQSPNFRGRSFSALVGALFFRRFGPMPFPERVMFSLFFSSLNFLKSLAEKGEGKGNGCYNLGI